MGSVKAEEKMKKSLPVTDRLETLEDEKAQ